MAKSIAILNQKGGSGKTTSTINISGELATRGYKVLIVDADSQGNASQNLGVYYPEKPAIADVLLNESNINDVIFTDSNSNIDIIPSNLKLQCAEMSIQQKITRNDNILKKAMEKLNKEYDYIIVDCSPSLSTMTINVLTFVDYVLIPIKTDRNSLEGYGNLLDVINSVKEDSNSNLRVLGAFCTVVELNTSLDKAICQNCKETLGNLFIDIPIRKNIEIREAPLSNQPVCLYKKNGNGSKDYALLTDEIIKRLNK